MLKTVSVDLSKLNDVKNTTFHELVKKIMLLIQTKS